MSKDRSIYFSALYAAGVRPQWKLKGKTLRTRTPKHKETFSFNSIKFNVVKTTDNLGGYFGPRSPKYAEMFQNAWKPEFHRPKCLGHETSRNRSTNAIFVVFDFSFFAASDWTSISWPGDGMTYV